MTPIHALTGPHRSYLTQAELRRLVDYKRRYTAESMGHSREVARRLAFACWLLERGALDAGLLDRQPDPLDIVPLG